MQKTQLCLTIRRDAAAGGAEQRNICFNQEASGQAASALREYLYDGWEVELEQVEREERRGLIFSGSLEDVRAGHAELPSPDEVRSYRCPRNGRQ